MPENPSVSPESQSSENPEQSNSEPAAGATEAAKTTPLSSKPPVSVRVELSPTDKVLGQMSKTAKKSWKKAQPVLKDKSIQALRASNRFTNHFLDQTWPKLSTQAIAAIPASIKTKVEVQKAKVQPTLDKLEPIWQKGVVPFWQKAVVPLWMKGIAFLKTRLPEPLAQELTDRFLTVAVLSLLVVVYWFFSSLTGGKPTVAKQPAFPKPTATPVITRRPVSTPASPLPKTAPTLAAKPISPVVKPTPSNPSLTAKPKFPPSSVPQPTLDLTEVQTQLASAVANVDAALIDSINFKQPWAQPGLDSASLPKIR
jgi:hypothetical protein